MELLVVKNLSFIGERIKEMRRANGLTQKELGEKLNLLNSTISNYENGRSSPDVNTLYALSSVLNCSVDYLLGKTDAVHEVVSEDGRDAVDNEEMVQEIMRLLKSKGVSKPGEKMSEEKRERLLKFLEKAIELSEI